MKTSSKQLASTCKAAPVALLAALVAAVLACAMWSLSAPAAYAEEEDANADASLSAETDTPQGEDEATSKTVTLSTTELSSLEGATDKYTQVYDTKEWTEQPYKYKDAKVTIDESSSDEGRYISLSAAEDADVDMVIIQIGTSYLESAVPKGELAKGFTYLIPIGKDAKVMHVALYDGKDTDDGDAEATATDDNADDQSETAIDEQGDDGTDGGADGDGGTDGNNNGDGDGTDEGTGTDGDGTDEGTGTDGGDAEGDGTDEGTDNAESDGDQSGTGSDEGDGDGAMEEQGAGDGTDGEASEGDGTDEGDQTGTGSDEGDGDQSGTGSDEGDQAELDSQSEGSGTPIVVASTEQNTTTEQSSTSTSVQVYSMSIGKVDAQSNALLAGAEFTIKTSSGDVVTTWTSSASGPQEVSGLRTDTTYVLSETKAPEGYNRERDINIKYDAATNKVLIDQGGAAVALENNSAGSAILNVKDMKGASSVQTSASTSPRTGDNQMLPIIVGVLVAIVAVAAVVAVKARKKGKNQ